KGGQFSEFQVINHGTGAISLQSAVYPNCYVGILQNGALADSRQTGTSTFGQFTVIPVTQMMQQPMMQQPMMQPPMMQPPMMRQPMMQPPMMQKPTMQPPYMGKHMKHKPKPIYSPMHLYSTDPKMMLEGTYTISPLYG